MGLAPTVTKVSLLVSKYDITGASDRANFMVEILSVELLAIQIVYSFLSTLEVVR